MKKTIRVIALCISLIMMLQPFMALAAVEETDDGLLSWEQVQVIAKLEEPATVAYMEITSAWSEQGIGSNTPDGFGGFYLNDDYMLTVKLASGSDDLKADILSIVSDPSALCFEETDISYNELLSLRDNITTKLKECGLSHFSTGIDSEASAVNVNIDSANTLTSQRELIQDVLGNNPHVSLHLRDSSEQVRSKNSPLPIPHASITDAYCGCKIEALGTDKYASLGAYGTYDFGRGPEPCFISAAHVYLGFKKANRSMVINGGIALNSSNFNSSYVDYTFPSVSNTETNGDYAFFKYNTSLYSPSNRLNTITPYYITSYVKSPSSLQNKSVFKEGASTGFTVGKIAESQTSVFTDSEYVNNGETGITFYDMSSVVTDTSVVFAEEGDSGAPVVMAISENEFALAGIIYGINLDYTSVNMYYFTPIANLVSAGFTPYVS